MRYRAERRQGTCRPLAVWRGDRREKKIDKGWALCSFAGTEGRLNVSQLSNQDEKRCDVHPDRRCSAPVSKTIAASSTGSCRGKPNPRLPLTLRRAQIQPCWSHRLAHRPDNHAAFLSPSLQSHGVLLRNLATCSSSCCSTKPLRPRPGYGRAAVGRPRPLHQRQPPLCLASRLGHPGI